MKKTFAASSALMLLLGCTQEVGEKPDIASIVTGEAIHISAISAVLAGKANLGSTLASDLKVGFQYSKSAGILPSNSTSVEATDADANYNYTASITGLEPDTKYYFRCFIRQNGQETYGETREFTTNNLASLLETKDASDIEATSATLNAKLDLTDIQYKNLSYGFLCGTSESALNTDYKCTEINANAISASLTGLPHKAQYWYKAYVTLDDQTFYGEIKTFTTDVVSVEGVSLDKAEYTVNTIGNTISLKATVFPDDATDKSVSWASDKENVATVDAEGRVTARSNGTAKITVTTRDQGKTACCEVTVAQWVTSISLDMTSITIYIGQEQKITATVNPSNAADKSLNWTSSDESVATVDAQGKVTAVSKGTATIEAQTKDGSGVSASCNITVKPVLGPLPSGAVDLGLSVYWSTCNLGASKPEESGDYYAWGETEPKSDYSWSTYKWCNGSYITLTKYNNDSSKGTVDNKAALDSEDDVAHVRLGGKWRMPAYAEWTELKKTCTWTWYWNWNGQKGVSGYKVTGPNGNSIFLPAAGSREATDFNTSGTTGVYWSSSLYVSSPVAAYRLYILPNEVNWYITYRYLGFSVRPVSE